MIVTILLVLAVVAGLCSGGIYAALNGCWLVTGLSVIGFVGFIYMLYILTLSTKND